MYTHRGILDAMSDQPRHHQVLDDLLPQHRALRHQIPQVYQRFVALGDAALTDGALSRKVKELVAPAGRAASATAVRVATRHCCSATAGRAGPAAPAASVPAEPAASARFCLATAGLAGAVPPVASAPVAMAETRCWSATAATVGQVPVGLLAVPVARAGCYSAKMGCPGRERPNPGQPPMGNLHINWPGRQQTAHIYEIGSRSVGGAGKSGCKSWLGSVGWRRA